MKVVYFIPKPFSLIFGGGEIQLLKTKEAVEKTGVEVEFANFFSPDQLLKADLVHFFGCDYIFGQIGSMLTGRNIPYVVSSIYYPVGFVRWIHKYTSKIPFSQIALKRKLLQNAKLILPNSIDEKILLINMFKCLRERIEVIPNGVDVNFVSKSPDIFRKKYLSELSLNEPFVLSVARIEERKNSLNLLKAAAKLKVPIVFIGKPLRPETNYSKTFFSNLENYPSFAIHISSLPGQSEELASAFASAKVHALVSHVETPGIASLEAGLNGANLVVGNCPPVLEYLKNHAWIADPKSVHDISLNIENALKAPRNSKNQKEFITQNFTWDKIGKMTKSAYEQALNT